MTRAFTITEEDIVRIRSEARAEGCETTASICDVALGEAGEEATRRARYLEQDDAWAFLDLSEHLARTDKENTP